MRSIGRSDFAGLAEYITDAQSKTERVGQVAITNCLADGLNAAISEVIATQHQNTRARGDKTYHLLVSFRPGEQPSDEVLRAIEDRVCTALGFAGHQRISAVHRDTDNLHIHLAINKIHPERLTIHEPFRAYKTLADVCAAAEKDFGLATDNHLPHKSVAEGKAADMERHSGVESLVTWVRRESLAQMAQAKTWAAMQETLAAHDLTIRLRGNGLVLQAGDGTIVKASTIARDLSKPALEGRLGPFPGLPQATPVNPATKAAKSYQKRPVRTKLDTTALYARYRDAQAQVGPERAKVLTALRAQRDRQVAAAKRANALRRATIKLVGENRANKKRLYAQASAALKADLKAIATQHALARNQVQAQTARKTWADWLRDQAKAGDEGALAALRAREGVTPLRGNTVAGAAAVAGVSPGAALDGVTKKGTLIYRAGATAVRDDGAKIQVSRAISDAAIQEALRIAVTKYGGHLAVNGAAEFRARMIVAAANSDLAITFADPAMEQRRRTMKEKIHEHRTDDRGRTGRGTGVVRQGPAAHGNAAGAGSVTGRDGIAGGARNTVHARGGVRRKPDARRVGAATPPERANRVHGLSELGVVRDAGRGEVLLPGHVPHHLEQQGAAADAALRRAVHRPGSVVDSRRHPIAALGTKPPPQAKNRLRQLIALASTSTLRNIDLASVPAPGQPVKPAPAKPPLRPGRAAAPAVGIAPPPLRQAAIAAQLAASPAPTPELPPAAVVSRPTTTPAPAVALKPADKYIAEREAKRRAGFDIPKHKPYTQIAGSGEFAGVRVIDGKPLALVKRNDDIEVVAIDDAAAARLKRLAIGAPISIDPSGVIKKSSKGRSR